MRPAFLFILFSLVIFSGTACKEVQKTSTPAGINVMVHDIPCEYVIAQFIKECKSQRHPFEWVDKGQGILSVWPQNTTPLPADPFIKMEEKFRLEIKCIDPISTRISVQIQLKGLASDHQWLEVNDPDKLNIYGKRFLDRLSVK